VVMTFQLVAASRRPAQQTDMTTTPGSGDIPLRVFFMARPAMPEGLFATGGCADRGRLVRVNRSRNPVKSV